MIREIPRLPVLLTELSDKADALAVKYERVVVQGMPQIAKDYGSFVPFAGARGSLGGHEAAVIVGYDAGRASARFLLDGSPVDAAQLGAAAGSAEAFHAWMHSALFMADVRLKSAERRQRDSR